MPWAPPSIRSHRGVTITPSSRRLASRHHVAVPSGFALPLALMVSLLLLLSSLAMQTMFLQARSRRAVVLELRQAEDQLASAAHLLVGRLQERHPCLLALNLSFWPLAGLNCGDIAEITSVISAETQGLRWQVIGWQLLPGGHQVDLLLQVQPEAGGSPRRGEFRVELDPASPSKRVLALRPRGLRGIPTAAL